MRRNYFAKLVNYIKNVYHIERGLNKLNDGRVNPKYKTAQVIMPVLLSFLLRVRSFNALNLMIQENEFKNVLPKGAKLPKVDTIRDTLKGIDISRLRDILKFNVKKSNENKVFSNGTIDGYTVAAIDGTKFFGSNKKSCEECLKNKNHCFHSGSVMAMVGVGPKLVIDFEMYRPGIDLISKDEGELSVSKRLLTNTVREHKNLIDVVVYDALAFNSVWFNLCNSLEIDAVVRVKNNNNNSLRQVKKIVNKMEPVDEWMDKKGFEKIKVYETTFTMDNVPQPLRFVKFAMKYPNKKRSQIMIVSTCMEMGLETLFKIIRSRWDVENSIFNNLKKECGLEHCFVHGGNAVEAVLCLIFIASNMMQLFYHRRIKKHVATQMELVRLLLKGLYLLKRKPEMVFNTG